MTLDEAKQELEKFKLNMRKHNIKRCEGLRRLAIRELPRLKLSADDEATMRTIIARQL